MGKLYTVEDRFDWVRDRVDVVVREAIAYLYDADLTASEIVRGISEHLLSDVANNVADYERAP